MSKLPAACREIEPHLLAVAAGEAGSRIIERVEQHVASCVSCREELGHYRTVEAMVHSLRGAPLRGRKKR
jgi:hypothetical protein